MARLLLKIFLAYWLAAVAVILVSNFEPHKHIHNPELNDALDSALLMSGRTMIDAYESGRCPEVQQLFHSERDELFLADSNGRLLCGDPAVPDLSDVVRTAVRKKKRVGVSYKWFQLLAIPTVSSRGVQYVVLFKNHYGTKLQLYGMLPGYTTIAISCVVTLFLALLMALPIRRLREAAGQIALGRLDTRVRWAMPAATWPLLAGGDDIDQLVRDFNHMAEKLQSLADAQRLLLRDVSHELRSPLTRLGLGLRMAQIEATAGMLPHLSRIEAESARLNYLIGQILSLSHLDLLEQVDAPRLVSFSSVVASLLPDLEYEAAQSGCRIGSSIERECFVCGDEELLRSAVENILRNAIKYASGSGTIHVGTVTEQRAGQIFSVVRVADNGPGIPEHELDSVLKPFFRADRCRHWKQEGAGLGLAIADRAARLHRGNIGVRNRPEGGLIVEMSLPSAAPA